MKARFFALAALVLGMVSCQQDVETIAPVGGEVDFQLSVAAPELVGTRAGEEGQADTQSAMNSAFGAIDYLQGAATGDYRQDWGDVDLRYTLEVYDKADSYTDAVLLDIGSYEVPGGWIQTVDAWTAASIGAQLSHVHEEALVHQLPDQFGDGRDAGVEFFAEVGYAVAVLVYAEGYYPLLQCGILAVDIAEE